MHHYKGNPQNYHTVAMFDPSEIASLMIPVELKGFVPPKICWDTKTL